MSEDQGDQRVTNEEPSRRSFLKVSAVAGATVAAIAAGASMIPKIAASAMKASSSAKKAETTSSVSSTAPSTDPLILVVQGDAVDVYRGESKIAMQDSSLAHYLLFQFPFQYQLSLLQNRE